MMRNNDTSSYPLPHLPGTHLGSWCESWKIVFKRNRWQEDRPTNTLQRLLSCTCVTRLNFAPNRISIVEVRVEGKIHLSV